MKIKDTVIIGLLSSVLFAVQYILQGIPNIELVSLLILVYTCILKRKTLFIIAVFVLLEGFFYGFGIWFIGYLYVWFILYLIGRLIIRKTPPLEQSSIIWALASGSFGLCFGAFFALISFLMGLQSGGFQGGLNSAFGYWVSGLTFDIIHGIGNFIVALVLFKPVYKVLNRLMKNYNDDSYQTMSS
jgi:energy-coupling factor transport system substrate-specific component